MVGLYYLGRDGHRYSWMCGLRFWNLLAQGDVGVLYQIELEVLGIVLCHEQVVLKFAHVSVNPRSLAEVLV
jgi:hypothetical protein